MILSYNEAVKKYGSSYKLTKAVAEKKIYKLEEGIYSTKGKESGLDILMKKYPNSVLTGEYAFYCHGLTNVIPERYDLATISNAAKIKDTRVHQIYERADLLSIGAVEMTVQSTIVRIYDKERMLIELLRNKNKMPYDLYKEIIMNYRDIINNLEIWRIQEYASLFPKSKMISKALDEEVL
jgi:hypothetical protein